MKDFYNDTYARTINCSVVKVIPSENHTEVYTDYTICYPECGGQPGDRGNLGPYEILDTKKAENGDSIHYLSSSCPVKVGDKLTMSLDWNHRYKYMVMHTAQHMLSGLLFNQFNIGTVSVHLGEEYLTIETNQEEVSSHIIDELVSIANDKIAEAHKIVYHEMSHSDAEALGMRRSIKVEGDVRIVEIQDIDRIACGGVHVASTSELRLIVYLGQQKIRDHARLFFVCGKDAQNQVYKNINTLNNLRDELSCSNYNEIKPKIDKLNEQLEEMELQVKALSEKAAKIEIDENLNNNVAIFETSISLDFIMKATEEYNDLALCVMNKSNWLIMLKGKYQNTDFSEIREKVLVPCNAKGGGKNGCYRGSSPCSILDSFKSTV